MCERKKDGGKKEDCIITTTTTGSTGRRKKRIKKGGMHVRESEREIEGKRERESERESFQGMVVHGLDMYLICFAEICNIGVMLPLQSRC